MEPTLECSVESTIWEGRLISQGTPGPGAGVDAAAGRGLPLGPQSRGAQVGGRDRQSDSPGLAHELCHPVLCGL